jgi:hypothetical protein
VPGFKFNCRPPLPKPGRAIGLGLMPGVSLGRLTIFGREATPGRGFGRSGRRLPPPGFGVGRTPGLLGGRFGRTWGARGAAGRAVGAGRWICGRWTGRIWGEGRAIWRCGAGRYCGAGRWIWRCGAGRYWGAGRWICRCGAGLDCGIERCTDRCAGIDARPPPCARCCALDCATAGSLPIRERIARRTVKQFGAFIIRRG